MCVLLSVLAPLGWAVASARTDEPLTVTLVSEVESIQPGRPFHVGLLLHHGPGYHSYWKYPGIVGVPTSIDWTLPDGFSAGEIEWPEPERVYMHEIRAQGFERDVLLPIRIVPPTNLQSRTTVRLAGHSTWMSCAKRCHPGHSEVALELPVKAEVPVRNEAYAAMFAAERNRVPQASEAWSATATEAAGLVTLVLKPVTPEARRIETTNEAARIVFFTTDGWIHTDLPQDVALQSDGSLTMVLRVCDVFPGDKAPGRLHGIVQRPEGWLRQTTLRSINVRPQVAPSPRP